MKSNSEGNRRFWERPFVLDFKVSSDDGATYNKAVLWILNCFAGVLVAAFAAILSMAIDRRDGDWSVVVLLSVLGSLSSLAGFVAGIFILVSSKRNEVVAASAYELARKSIQAQVMYFSDFSEHLSYLWTYLSPKAIPGKPVRVVTAVSSLAYGIGADIPPASGDVKHKHDKGHRNADEFLDYLQAWTEVFESMDKNRDEGETSSWDIIVWDEAPHRAVFASTENLTDAFLEYRDGVLRRLQALLGRIRTLASAQYVDVRFLVLPPSDCRVFLVNHTDQRCAGLMVVFTPLSKTLLLNDSWRLTGIAVNSHHGWSELKEFTDQLRTTDGENYTKGDKELLNDPAAFMQRFFNWPSAVDEATPTGSSGFEKAAAFPSASKLEGKGIADPSAPSAADGPAPHFDQASQADEKDQPNRSEEPLRSDQASKTNGPNQADEPNGPDKADKGSETGHLDKEGGIRPSADPANSIRLGTCGEPNRPDDPDADGS